MTGRSEEWWNLKILAALAVQGPRPDVPQVVDGLRAGIEALAPALGPSPLVWQTSVITTEDDLERTPPPARPGLDWDAATRVPAAQFDAVGVEACVPGLPIVPPDPRRSPVHALAAFPRGGSGPATVAVSAQERALDGGRVPRPLLRALTEWLLSTAVRLGGQTGYISLDYGDAWDQASTWELAVGAPPGWRDVSRTVWGYGWGTLLSAAHVAAVGGVDRLSAVSGAALLSGPDGRLFVRLGDDPAAVSATQLAELRAALAPVLPVGTRTLEQYEMDRSAPFATGPPYRL